MGAHPADCDCASDDPRVVACAVCGRNHIDGQDCPHCHPTREGYKLLALNLNRLTDLLTLLVDAYERADHSRMHALMGEAKALVKTAKDGAG